MDFLPLPPAPDYTPASLTRLTDPQPTWHYPAVPANTIADPVLWQPFLAQKADPITDLMEDYLRRSLPDWTVHRWRPNTWGKLPRGGYFELTHPCHHGHSFFVTTTQTLSNPLFALFYAPWQLLLHKKKHLESERDSLNRLIDAQLRYYRVIHTIQTKSLRSLGRRRVPTLCRLDAIHFDAEDPSDLDYCTPGFAARPMRTIQI